MNASVEKGAVKHGSAGGYVAWTILMIVLTVIAFVAVGYGLLPVPWLIGLLLFLAAIQVASQVIFFMHLNVSRRWYAIAFGCGIGLAVVFIVGLMYLVWAY